MHVWIAFHFLLVPCLRTSCQKLRFKLAQSCPMSWDLQRHTLSAFAEAHSTTARLRLPALPVKGGLKDTAEDREACIYTNRWVAYNFYAFVMHLAFILVPRHFYPTGPTQSFKSKRCVLEGCNRWQPVVLMLTVRAFCNEWQLIIAGRRVFSSEYNRICYVTQSY